VIGVKSLTVSFGHGAHRIDAVRDVSIEVATGEAFGLVGESGCGKSTVLRAIAGLVVPSQGQIELDSQLMRPRRRRRDRKLVQMVFQDPYGSLHPQHTVDRMLTEPVAIHRLGDPERRVGSALQAVGLSAEFRFRYPHQLSGGQRQRVALARALILEPRILLLDEPTSALDVSVQAEILNLLVHLRRQRGLTMLMVSHDLAVVTHLCERIAVMTRGSIVENTTAEALASGMVAHPFTVELLRSNRQVGGVDLL
jgi:peptide/nickel transport system ATP-binding protein